MRKENGEIKKAGCERRLDLSWTGLKIWGHFKGELDFTLLYMCLYVHMWISICVEKVEYTIPRIYGA